MGKKKSLSWTNILLGLAEIAGANGLEIAPSFIEGLHNVGWQRLGGLEIAARFSSSCFMEEAAVFGLVFGLV